MNVCAAPHVMYVLCMYVETPLVRYLPVLHVDLVQVPGTVETRNILLRMC